ncbi:MAG TPA: GNAT family N-acetyltransferase [Planctomycetota bacterium]|nr:GNAT family N-acetyltransferase [Planctomycetota bacterium]HRR81231.1 GNAT family N-acetyltransferase [Planctomycetota bacterium]HRT93538.1 GNAT family N-acetyltransferase [Planctomycetota bacterium]
MKAVILHGAVPANAPPDELDTLVQAEAVGAALRELGHQVATVPFSLDLGAAQEALRREAPDFVFNLVESVEGAGRLIHLAPALLEFLGLPYTGSSNETLFVTSNKVLAKGILRAHAVPTAPWYTLADLAGDGPVPPGAYIIKSIWEHASVGLDEDAVVVTDRREALRQACLERSKGPSGECFAEAFLGGREFNIALLADEAGPQALPASEILFQDYAEGKWRVVGYRAKWQEDSFEYHHTPRRFEFPPEDQPLLATLADAARRCWRIFGLCGYARVDFRLDAAGQPCVLEVNANPCLSPDAGYAATVERAGLRYVDAIQRIVSDVSRAARPLTGRPHIEPPSHAAVLARAPRARTAAGDLHARGFSFRETVTEADRANVRNILESTGFFYPEEVQVGIELVDDHLVSGVESGYRFLFAEKGGETLGYSCFGPIACTRAAFAIYWIAVHNAHRGQKIGRELLARTEEIIARLGGAQIHVETSNRAQYKPTRAFYENNGYERAAVFPDFYAPGDDKVVYVKLLPPRP